jgi:FkbM family methyltransferase
MPAVAGTASAQTVNPLIQRLKDLLVKLGPRNPMVQIALAAHARLNGFRLSFTRDCIHIRSSDRLMILSMAQYVEARIMMECFDLYFSTIESVDQNGLKTLDFSKPNLHKYIKYGVGFYFPAVPEDDSMDAYLNDYTPKPGDIVWDLGAHAGATAFFLAKAVGPSGKVYAFEPDELNYEYLLRNIALHSSQNIIPVRKAVSGTNGFADFNMDGTMSAGIREFLVYPGNQPAKKVEIITIAEACSQLGSVPAFIKMDIEGAEIEAIRGSADFLKTNPIEFSIESYHRFCNEYTYSILERLFPEIGYEVHSSSSFGQMFTWARRKEDSVSRA